MRKKLKGSTLIEVLVAMTLIVMTISFFFIAAGNIKKSFRTELKTYAFIHANRLLQDSLFVKTGEETIDFPSFNIKKKVSQSGNNPECLSVNLRVFTDDDSKLLFEIKKIIFVKGTDQ